MDPLYDALEVPGCGAGGGMELSLPGFPLGGPPPGGTPPPEVLEPAPPPPPGCALPVGSQSMVAWLCLISLLHS